MFGGFLKFETKVVDIIIRARDVLSFRFNRVEGFDYKAGQWMFVTIPSKSGKLKKHFTISSSPTESGFIEFTKKLTDSDYSCALRELKVGDVVEIDAPYGLFTLDNNYDKIAMLSGGIGITPLRSMIKYATDQKLNKSIVLLYGNNTIEDVAFRDEFDNLEKQNKYLKVVHVIKDPPSDWIGYGGYINSDKIQKEVVDLKERVFYICGPQGMIDIMTKLLINLEVDKGQIRLEKFSGY
jgi:ferredoxin-NADP reductase